MSAQTICESCEIGHLHHGTRDVEIARGGAKVVVPKIVGYFCDHCDEFEFDRDTDSDVRYAAAGDKLVLENRVHAGKQLRAHRRKLKMTQLQASLLTGGGHNAFSRYENGDAQPVLAVINLFSILAKHPELLQEIEQGASARLTTKTRVLHPRVATEH